MDDDGRRDDEKDRDDEGAECTVDEGVVEEFEDLIEEALCVLGISVFVIKREFSIVSLFCFAFEAEF